MNEHQDKERLIGRRHGVAECPCCGEDMKVGHVWLNNILGGSLEWSELRPELAFWKINAGDTSLFNSTAFMPAKSVRQALRCLSCEAVTILPDVN